MGEKFDLVVIGGGPGGYSAALEAAKLGMRTAIVEKDALGGTCLNRGCIPTKALLHSAELYAEMKSAARFGIVCDAPQLDMSALNAHKRNTVSTLQKGIATLLKSAKVTSIKGIAKLLPNNEILISGCNEESSVSATNVIIATGSVPSVPPIPGADLPGVMTSDGLLAYEGKAPESLTIIGGGVIGVEFAGIYNAFGTKVTILEALPSLIANMDKELGQSLKLSLKKKGVDIHTNAKVDSLSRSGELISCAYEEKGKQLTAVSQIVLIATGRKPYTSGLFDEELLATDRGHVIVNDNYETNIPHVYAIGDVSSKIQLAHAATSQAIIAVNAIAGSQLTTPSIPACLYTKPEIASVGMTLDEAKKAGIRAASHKALSSANGKSVICLAERGFIKVVYDINTHRLLGCQMMCDRATDMISEFALAIKLNLTLEEMSNICRPHPTFSEMITEAVRI